MTLLKHSTVRNLSVFMTSLADHVTGAAGLTLVITASKDGAAFASITPGVTDLGNGWYSLALTTAHTGTLNDFLLHITATGADPTDMACQVVADLPGATVASVVGDVGGNIEGNVNGGLIGDVIGSVQGDVQGVVSGVDGLNVGNLDSPVSDCLQTNNVQSVWEVVTSGLTLTGTIGKLLSTFGFTGSNVNANAQVVADKTGYGLAAGQLTVKRNVALSAFEFLMTDSAAHDPATGLTVTVSRSIDGGAFASTTNSPAEVANGIYKLDLAAADLNGGVITLRFASTGADVRFVTIITEA